MLKLYPLIEEENANELDQSLQRIPRKADLHEGYASAFFLSSFPHLLQNDLSKYGLLMMATASWCR
jgi:hypothetical protein